MPYKDPEVHKQYRLRRQKETLEFLRQYKVEQGCADCGYNAHHAGLEFDHVKDKFKNLAAMARYTRQKVLDELSKCEVVCGTCHNLRTWERRQDVDSPDASLLD